MPVRGWVGVGRCEWLRRDERLLRGPLLKLAKRSDRFVCARSSLLGSAATTRLDTESKLINVARNSISTTKIMERSVAESDVDIVVGEAGTVVADVLSSLGLDPAYQASCDFDNGLHVAILAAQKLRRRLRRLRSEEGVGGYMPAAEALGEVREHPHVADVLVVGSDGTGREAFAQKLRSVFKTEDASGSRPRVVACESEEAAQCAGTPRALLCVSVHGGARGAFAEAVREQCGVSLLQFPPFFPLDSRSSPFGPRLSFSFALMMQHRCAFTHRPADLVRGRPPCCQRRRGRSRGPPRRAQRL